MDTGAGDNPLVRGWRKAYLLFLPALLAVQTLARILLHRPSFRETWVSSALHFAIILAYLVFVALLVSRLPRRWRGWHIAAPVAVLLLGTAHAVMTAFDITQFVTQYYAGLTAPVWLIVTDPELALSLLESVDIGAASLVVALIVILALHLLLYAPVARQLVELAREAMSLRIRLSAEAAVPGAWMAAGYLVLFLALVVMVPRKYWNSEIFHQGAPGEFRMAPLSLILSAAEPPGPAPAPRTLAKPRPLILIVVDALRPDRMGVYDLSLKTTPFLARLQQDGALKVLGPAYATCTFSACGIMSILASQSWDTFGKRPPTLLDALARYSYRNYVILGGRHSNFGRLTQLYGRGIVRFSEQPAGATPNDDQLVEALKATDFPDPTHSFLYLHVISAHAASFVRPRFRVSSATLPSSATAFVRQYDGRVAQVDQVLSEIFAVLRDKGLLADALIVITADHGERLGEKGLYFHGGRPDVAATSIPLLVYDPRGGVYPGAPLYSQIDIAPTFLRAVNGEFGAGWHGQPLQAPAAIAAIPLGTAETTGTIAFLQGGRFKYLCERESGDEQVLRLDGRSLEGSPVPPGPERRALLPPLRALRRTVSGPAEGPCRR
ncbi:sulfatase-like hydrolase/transferase [Sphingomonas sp. LB-2]|nr:sulfatase-like hydrolase/transferase [Sphingomonas caeni]